VTEADLQRSLERTLSQGTPGCQPLTQQLQEDYAEMARLAAEGRSSLIFYFIPYHPRYSQAFLVPGDPFYACKTQAASFLAGLAEQYANVTLLDYSALDSIGGLDTYEGYYDYQHITRLNADRLINAATPAIQAAYAAALRRRQP
jgi:hypothetical protein